LLNFQTLPASGVHHPPRGDRCRTPIGRDPDKAKPFQVNGGFRLVSALLDYRIKGF